MAQLQNRPRLLRDVAHARSGDKSGSVNIAIVVTRRRDADVVSRALTPRRIRKVLGLATSQPVEVHSLPMIPAFNILLPDVLGGAPPYTLAFDVFGHNFGQRILALELDG
jgi:hypothetical protein